jgi:hypothetical protein
MCFVHPLQAPDRFVLAGSIRRSLGEAHLLRLGPGRSWDLGWDRRPSLLWSVPNAHLCLHPSRSRVGGGIDLPRIDADRDVTKYNSG